MSITIVQQPAKLEPLYSPVGIPIVVTSTSATTTDYKYVFDLYSTDKLTGAATFINRNKFIPKSDGTCVYSPASILKSSTYFSVSPFGTGYTTSPTTGYVNYKVILGEQYPINLYFTGTTSASTLAQLNFTTAHNLQSGDTINVYKSDSSVNNGYNGYHTISQVINTTAFTINVNYGYATGETGYITSVIRMVTSPIITGKTAFNGIRQYSERTRDFNKQYNLTGTSNTFLNTYTATTIPGLTPPNIYIGTDDVYTLAGFNNDTGSTFDSVIITTYTGTPNNYVAKGIYLTLLSNVNSNYYMKDFRCGTRNLAHTKDNNFLSPFSNDTIYTSDITFYTISPYDSTLGTIGEVVFFKVKDCNTSFEKKRICWQNKLGVAASYWTFNVEPKINYEADRSTYTKVLDYNYSSGDRGETVISVNSSKYLTVNTGWISDYDAAFLIEEMFFSPEIYLLDMENETMQGLVAIDKKMPLKNATNDKLFYLTFTFEYSNKMITQNG
jgi:hypothetical protein